MSLNWTSFVALLDKVAARGVTDLHVAKDFATSAMTAIDMLPPGIIPAQVEIGLHAALPFINLLDSQLQPIAANIAATDHGHMTAVQAVNMVAAVTAAVSAAQPPVSQAVSSLLENINNPANQHR